MISLVIIFWIILHIKDLSGWNAIYYPARWNSKIKVLKLLIDKRDDIRSLENFKKTPADLHIGTLDLLCLLIKLSNLIRKNDRFS